MGLSDNQVNEGFALRRIAWKMPEQPSCRELNVQTEKLARIYIEGLDDLIGRDTSSVKKLYKRFDRNQRRLTLQLETVRAKADAVFEDHFRTSHAEFNEAEWQDWRLKVEKVVAELVPLMRDDERDPGMDFAVPAA